MPQRGAADCSSAGSFSLRPTNMVRPDRSFQRRSMPPASKSHGRKSVCTTATSEMVLTPPQSGSDAGFADSKTNVGCHDLSQAPLAHLSQLAAAQQTIVDDADFYVSGAAETLSKKRTADGMIMESRQARLVTSPVHKTGHSRNTSTVSVVSATTTSSRIGELSAELKARLSYAMVKVNRGWQSHSIDQVENLASQAASPTSSTSTNNMRSGASASPPLPNSSLHGSSQATAAFSVLAHQHPDQPEKTSKREVQPSVTCSTAFPFTTSLAPPVSIQPSRALPHPRRTSNARPITGLLSHPQPSPHASPHTPGQTSPSQTMPRQNTPKDAIVFSPHQNLREQDAIESLLFMSSPGNSVNLKHHFPSSSQLLPSASALMARPVGQARTALPSAAPARKMLPTGRPSLHTHSLSQPPLAKRAELKMRSPGGDVDTEGGQSRRRSLYGSAGDCPNRVPLAPQQRKHMPLATGPFSGTACARRPLADEDFEEMLAMADESSDSEGEIQMPPPRARKEATTVVGS